MPTPEWQSLDTIIVLLPANNNVDVSGATPSINALQNPYPPGDYYMEDGYIPIIDALRPTTSLVGDNVEPGPIPLPVYRNIPSMFPQDNIDLSSTNTTMGLNSMNQSASNYSSETVSFLSLPATTVPTASDALGHTVVESARDYAPSTTASDETLRIETPRGNENAQETVGNGSNPSKKETV